MTVQSYCMGDCVGVGVGVGVGVCACVCMCVISSTFQIPRN